MFQQGDFQMGPQDVEKRRRQILQMLPQFGQAQYAGEGFAHMLAGLMGGRQLRGLNKYEDEQRARVQGMFADMAGMPDPWMTAEQRRFLK